MSEHPLLRAMAENEAKQRARSKFRTAQDGEKLRSARKRYHRMVLASWDADRELAAYRLGKEG